MKHRDTLWKTSFMVLLAFGASACFGGSSSCLGGSSSSGKREASVLVSRLAELAAINPLGVDGAIRSNAAFRSPAVRRCLVAIAEGNLAGAQAHQQFQDQQPGMCDVIFQIRAATVEELKRANGGLIYRCP